MTNNKTPKTEDRFPLAPKAIKTNEGVRIMCQIF